MSRFSLEPCPRIEYPEVVTVYHDNKRTTFGLKVEWMNLFIYLKNHSVGYFNNLTVFKCFLARWSPADPVETVKSGSRVRDTGVLRLRI